MNFHTHAHFPCLASLFYYIAVVKKARALSGEKVYLFVILSVCVSFVLFSVVLLDYALRIFSPALTPFRVFGGPHHQHHLFCR